MRNITPLGNNVLVKLDKEPDQVGDIFIPDAAKESSSEGQVLAIGLGKQAVSNGLVVNVSPRIKVGDKVIIKKWGGSEVKSDNSEVELRLVEADDILAIIN